MPVREPASPTPAALRSTLSVTALVGLSGVVVFHGALAYYFAQDDFAGLARARGLLAPLAGPWRYLSGQAYFDFMKGVGGLDPLPYRIASLLAHLVASALLVAWLRRRVGAQAAWVGATFFAAHPALYTALYSVSGIGEVLALAFGLAALLLVTRPDPARWLALPAFALSLASKESTLLLPFLAAAEVSRATPANRAGIGHAARHPVVLALAVLATLYAAYFVTSVAGRQFGVGADPAARAAAPYALAFDLTILWNLLTYAGWTVNGWLPTMQSFADLMVRSLTPAAAVAIVAWMAGAAWPQLRARGWVLGGVLYFAFLLPVLPLPHHTYHYYLYAPLAGAALCVAALADVAFLALRPAGARSGGRARHAGVASPSPGRTAAIGPAWWIAGIVAALLTANGAAVAWKIEHYPFAPGWWSSRMSFDLRMDPTVDRARIARQVHDGLAAAGPPAGARLRFWSPIAIQIEGEAGRDTMVESYWERNVRTALMDGLAVRTLFPQVATVEFVRRFEPADETTYYAVYAADGRLRLVPAAELAAMLRALPAGGATP